MTVSSKRVEAAPGKVVSDAGAEIPDTPIGKYEAGFWRVDASGIPAPIRLSRFLSKDVESKSSTFFSHWFVPRAPDLSGADDARVWNRQQFIQGGTLHKTLGGASVSFHRPGHFNRSAFVKKCLGGIVPSRLVAHGADCSSTEAHILYTIA